jgi:hypothetical protein
MSIPTTGEMRIVIQMPETSGGDVQNDNNGKNPGAPIDESVVSSNPVQGNGRSQVMLATAIQATKTIGLQAINASISNIGIATGNYDKQIKAQSIMSAASTITSLAVSAANPVTFGVTVASMAISMGVQAYQQQKQIERENYQASQYAKRLGLTVARK